MHVTIATRTCNFCSNRQSQNREHSSSCRFDFNHSTSNDAHALAARIDDMRRYNRDIQTSRKRLHFILWTLNLHSSHELCSFQHKCIGISSIAFDCIVWSFSILIEFNRSYFPSFTSISRNISIVFIALVAIYWYGRWRPENGEKFQPNLSLNSSSVHDFYLSWINSQKQNSIVDSSLKAVLKSGLKVRPRNLGQILVVGCGGRQRFIQ